MEMPLVAQDINQALPPTAALNHQHHEFQLFDDAAVDTVELAHVVQDHLLGGIMDDEGADAALSGLQGRFFVDDKLEPVLQRVNDFPPWVFSTLLIAFGILVAVILVVWWYWGDEVLTLLDYDAVITTKLRGVARGRRKGTSGNGTHARRSTHAGPYVNTQDEALALERRRQQLLGATTTSAAGTKSRVADALIAYDLDTSDVQPPEKDDGDEYPVGVMVLNDNSTPRSTSHSASSSRSASPAPPFATGHRPLKAGRKGKVSLRVGPR